MEVLGSPWACRRRQPGKLPVAVGPRRSLLHFSASDCGMVGNTTCLRIHLSSILFDLLNRFSQPRIPEHILRSAERTQAGPGDTRPDLPTAHSADPFGLPYSKSLHKAAIMPSPCEVFRRRASGIHRQSELRGSIPPFARSVQGRSTVSASGLLQSSALHTEPVTMH